MASARAAVIVAHPVRDDHSPQEFLDRNAPLFGQCSQIRVDPFLKGLHELGIQLLLSSSNTGDPTDIYDVHI